MNLWNLGAGVFRRKKEASNTSVTAKRGENPPAKIKSFTLRQFARQSIQISGAWIQTFRAIGLEFEVNFLISGEVI